MSEDKKAAKRRRANGRPTNIREGIQGGPLPEGREFRPPPGPAADVPADKVEAVAADKVETKK